MRLLNSKMFNWEGVKGGWVNQLANQVLIEVVEIRLRPLLNNMVVHRGLMMASMNQKAKVKVATLAFMARLLLKRKM